VIKSENSCDKQSNNIKSVEYDTYTIACDMTTAYNCLRFVFRDLKCHHIHY